MSPRKSCPLDKIKFFAYSDYIERKAMNRKSIFFKTDREESSPAVSDSQGEKWKCIWELDDGKRDFKEDF